MQEAVKQLEKEFFSYVNKIEHINEAIALIGWDLRTGAPKKGVEQRAEVLGTLSTEVFNLSTSEQMRTYLQTLAAENVQPYLSERTKKTVEECQKQYDLNRKIPETEYKEFIILTSKSEAVWEEAKKSADFASFQPYLEKIVETQKRFVDYWGYEGNKYNTLLDQYEPGITVETLDRVFSTLRQELVPLVQSVQNSQHHPNTDFLVAFFPKEKQQALNIELLKMLHYDFEAGRLDETVHPFATGLNPNDVRITTKYDEHDFRTALFGTIHECGHALYEQNISPELVGTPLCEGTSMGIHESQSLFYENIIGRHENFWKKNYPLLQRYSDGQFDSISVKEYYRAINAAKPSLIRIEADELTYSLHIILRYELEKGLINGEIEVKDLPMIWNEKMKEYLGIVPSHDGEGVLQDIHWAGGAFGYFPSYALGYIYAAQIKSALEQDLRNFDELLESGNIQPINQWLRKHIHQYGKMKKPVEILKDVTEEGINPNYLLRYLKDKYSKIYQF